MTVSFFGITVAHPLQILEQFKAQEEAMGMELE